MNSEQDLRGVFEETSRSSPLSVLSPKPLPPKGMRFLFFALITSMALILVLLVVIELTLRILGIGAPVPSLNPRIFKSDPSMGVTLKADWRGVFAGVEVSTNSRGFRGPEIPSMTGIQNRILLVGDSFVFGYGLAEENTLRNHLETALKKIFPASETYVINGGVPGYNLVQDVSWTLKTGLDQMPDWIILSVVPNDLEPPLWLDAKTIPNSGDAKTWIDWIRDDPRVMELPGAKSFYLLNLVQRIVKLTLPGQRSLAKDYIHFCNETLFSTMAWPQAQAALLRLKEVVQARGVPLTIVLYPVPLNLTSAPFGPFNEKITRFCQDSGLDVLDPSGEWTEFPERRLRWHPDDLHPSGFANQLMADYLVRNSRIMSSQ